MYFIKKVTHQENQYLLVPICQYNIEDKTITILDSNYFDKEHLVDNRIINFFQIWYQTKITEHRDLILKINAETPKYFLIKNLIWDTIRLPILDTDFYSVSFSYTTFEDVSTYFKRTKIINGFI